MTKKKLRVIDKMHKETFEQALQECDGNRTRTAQYLGISIRTVRNWIQKYDLSKKFPHSKGRQK